MITLVRLRLASLFLDTALTLMDMAAWLQGLRWKERA